MPTIATIVGLALATLVPGGLGAMQAQNRPWPPPHSSHAMVYHDTLQLVLVYGGGSEPDGALLWGWNGTDWSVVARGGPGPLVHFAMAYDPRRQRLVVHGGAVVVDRRLEPKDETWEWDGTEWSRVAVSGPGPRDHHAMVYDSMRGAIVLFGGQTGGRFLGDTWTWDGRRWRELDVAGPAPRSTHRLAYDAARGKVVLFGGATDDGAVAGETWELDEGGWTRVAVDGPGPRWATRLVYDRARGEVVLFGGRRAGQDLGDTWNWDGSTWRERGSTGPSPRNVHGMAYDEARARVVMFGGFHEGRRLDGLWEWDGDRWLEAVAAPARSPER